MYHMQPQKYQACRFTTSVTFEGDCHDVDFDPGGQRAASGVRRVQWHHGGSTFGNAARTMLGVDVIWPFTGDAQVAGVQNPRVQPHPRSSEHGFIAGPHISSTIVR